MKTKRFLITHAMVLCTMVVACLLLGMGTSYGQKNPFSNSQPFSNDPFSEPAPKKRGDGRDFEKDEEDPGPDDPPGEPPSMPIDDYLWVILLAGVGLGAYYFSDQKKVSV